jgi:hypothetical protein
MLCAARGNSPAMVANIPATSGSDVSCFYAKSCRAQPVLKSAKDPAVKILASSSARALSTISLPAYF